MTQRQSLQEAAPPRTGWEINKGRLGFSTFKNIRCQRASKWCPLEGGFRLGRRGPGLAGNGTSEETL